MAMNMMGNTGVLRYSIPTSYVPTHCHMIESYGPTPCDWTITRLTVGPDDGVLDEGKTGAGDQLRQADNRMLSGL